jgi:hypothetical protein
MKLHLFQLLLLFLLAPSSELVRSSAASTSAVAAAFAYPALSSSSASHRVAAARFNTNDAATKLARRRITTARTTIRARASHLHFKAAEKGDDDAKTITVLEENKRQLTATQQQQLQRKSPSSTSSSSLALPIISLFGVTITPEVFAIMSIYFVEGAITLTTLARTFLLKDELLLGPSEIAAITGLVSFPWTIKPVYGYLTDQVPLFGFRRRSYLAVVGLVGAAANVLVSQSDALSLEANAVIAFIVLSSACIAFSDVIADSIIVERSREMREVDVTYSGGL